MNWYIGQPIVAIKNSIYGGIRKGDEFVIKSLKSRDCPCDTPVLIDVGLIDDDVSDVHYCQYCGHKQPFDKVMWKLESLFAPLDQDISELTEILTNPHKQGLTIK